MAGETEILAVLNIVKNGLEGKTIQAVTWQPEERIFYITLSGGVFFRVGIEDIILSMLDN